MPKEARGGLRSLRAGVVAVLSHHVNGVWVFISPSGGFCIFASEKRSRPWVWCDGPAQLERSTLAEQVGFQMNQSLLREGVVGLWLG